MAAWQGNIGSALTGFMQGYSMMQDIKDRQQLRQLQQQSQALQIQEWELKKQDLLQQQQGNAALGAYFQNLSPEQRSDFMSATPDRQAAILGEYLMPYNPKMALGYLDASQKMAAKSKSTEALSNMAGSVTDQDSYDMMQAQARQNGVKLPDGLTGDYSKDKKKLEYLAGAGMKEKDKQSLDFRFQDMIRKLDGQAERMQIQQERLQLQREHNAATEQRLRDKDAMAAQRQSGKDVVKFTELKGMVTAAVEADETLSKDPDLKKAAIARLLTKVQGIKGDREAVSEALDSALTNMVKNDLTQEYSGVTGIVNRMLGREGKTRFKGAEDKAPEKTTEKAQGSLPPQAASALKEGTITTFGNGQRWTLRNGKPVRIE